MGKLFTNSTWKFSFHYRRMMSSAGNANEGPSPPSNNCTRCTCKNNLMSPIWKWITKGYKSKDINGKTTAGLSVKGGWDAHRGMINHTFLFPECKTLCLFQDQKVPFQGRVGTVRISRGRRGQCSPMIGAILRSITDSAMISQALLEWPWIRPRASQWPSPIWCPEESVAVGWVQGQGSADGSGTLRDRLLHLFIALYIKSPWQIYQLGLSVINAVHIISVICVGDMMGLSCHCSDHTRKPLIIYQIDKLVLWVSTLYDKQ